MKARAAQQPVLAEIDGAVQARPRPTITGSFAIVGTADDALSGFLTQLSAVLVSSGLEVAVDPAEAQFVLNLIDPADPAPVPAPFPRHVRGRARAPARGAARRAPRDLSPAGPRTREHRPLLPPRPGGQLHHDGTGALRRDRRRRHPARERRRRPAPPPRPRPPRDRERVPPDLEHELWHGDECTAQISAAGRRLDRLGLLPAPFPIEELLDERDLRHIKRLYGIGGLSYGNLSTRKDERRFWMSASGVDKSMLVEPGRDILLVTGFDAEHSRMELSVPPGGAAARLGRRDRALDDLPRAPDVGAILHVHAWIDGIPRPRSTSRAEPPSSPPASPP